MTFIKFPLTINSEVSTFTYVVPSFVIAIEGNYNTEVGIWQTELVLTSGNIVVVDGKAEDVFKALAVNNFIQN